MLHYAVLSGSVPIVNLLIKQGANVNFEKEYRRPTPLDLAILKGDVAMVKLLIDAGQCTLKYIKTLSCNIKYCYI